MNDKTPVLSQAESGLFGIINQALDEQKSQRWQKLIRLRDDEQISDEQKVELIQIGDELESLNIQRFEAIHELANIRGVDFDELCRQLEILPIQ